MGSIQLLITSQFIIFNIVSSEVLPIVDFEVLTEKNEKIQVALTPVDSFLANENLPVWIVDQKHPEKLFPLTHVMKNIGPFTIYWDQSTCAAAVYYHAENKFDVYIGHHQVLRKSLYNPTLKKMIPTVEPTSSIGTHDENRLSEEKYHREADEPFDISIPSRLRYPDRVYVETLVMVNHPITEQLKDDYSEVVSYVLGQFNMIDMLYSKIEIPNIRINIAGIIIGTVLNSFPAIYSKCYHQGKENPDRVYLDADCTITSLYQTLYDYENLPFQIYDTVVFLTRNTIYSEEKTTTQTGEDQIRREIIKGLNFFPGAGGGYKCSSMNTAISIVGLENIYAHFPTTAHEMAHAFNVPHDGGPIWDENDECDAHLMKKNDGYCRRCLRFGGMTAEHLKNFFGSSWGCIYHNKPKSLNDPKKLELFWLKDEQCLCYGYAAAARNSKKCLATRFFSSCSINCKSNLKCVDNDNVVHVTGIYMNGTPCDKEEIGTKVCWNSKCSPVTQRSGSFGQHLSCFNID